jgi:nucleotide-binding universal stress UspA family protein
LQRQEVIEMTDSQEDPRTPHSTLHNLVLGSTAQYLVAHSPVNVLVAR